MGALPWRASTSSSASVSSAHIVTLPWRVGSSLRKLQLLSTTPSGICQACMRVSAGCVDVLSFESAENANSRVLIKELPTKYQRKWDTLRDYPEEDLLGKIVFVRCDLSVLFKEGGGLDKEVILAVLPTVSYLISARARIVLASHWFPLQSYSTAKELELLADCLSQHVGRTVLAVNAVMGRVVQDAIKALSNGDVLLLGNLQLYKEEAANQKEFSKELAKNIDILVNDAFSVSHRVLASSVGVACFTSARLAGFQLERELSFLTKATSQPELPFVVIIGGSRLSQAVSVMHKMLESCSSIVVMGSMVFTFFKALGRICPSASIENGMVEDALKFLKAAMARRVTVLLPCDIVCVNGQVRDTFRPDNVPKGWVPVSFGEKTFQEIDKELMAAKMALWIGPVSIDTRKMDLQSPESLAKKFGEISTKGCTTIVGGTSATSAIRKEGVSHLISHISTGGSAFLEMLRGVNLPAVSALDYACPGKLDWQKIYKRPVLPLVVDIGCGNGLFALRMACASVASMNILGLEVRRKLVDRCLNSVLDHKLSNLHFVEADAATMFKRIISNYPGKVLLVAIQCPVPNFTNIDTRRRMVQKQLVKQIVQILPGGGKIFLQSDVKSVALQLKRDFLECGQGYIVLGSEHGDSEQCDAENWLLRNPLGHSSDWEDHVLQQGRRMFRVLLTRV